MPNENDKILILLAASTLFITLLVAFILIILLVFQKKQLLFHQELDQMRVTYERSVLETKIEIQEETFQEISREIHDNISLSLSFAKLQLMTVKGNRSLNVTEAIEAIGKALRDLSDLSKSFNTEAIQANGLFWVLQVESEKIRRIGKFKVHFSWIGSPIFLEARKELVLFRIAQESLNNIIKHSRAANIQIKLTYTRNTFVMRIIDDGIGFDPAKEKEKFRKMSTGLRNIRSRTEMIQGRCKIRSEEGRGTSLAIIVPI